MPLSVFIGNKTLEVRPSSIDKSTAVRAILRDLDPQDIDHILCIGDGKTDEVVFSLLRDNEYALTATVGRKQTAAKYILPSLRDVDALLKTLAAMK